MFTLKLYGFCPIMSYSCHIKVFLYSVGLHSKQFWKELMMSVINLIFMDPCIVVWLCRNKMQPCNRIYYSTVHWRLNMFRAAYRSSSGALTVFAASGLHTLVVTGHSKVWVGTAVPTQTWLQPVTTRVCKPEAANTVRAPDDERYGARNMLSLQWTVE